MKTSGDLSPPFIPDENGQFGFWEIAGQAEPHENYIMVVPPVQFHRGCLWTNVEIPKNEDWSVNFQLQVSNANGGGFGIWIADKYGADGDLFGGPNRFKGLGLLGSVIVNDENRLMLNLHYVENNGKRKIKMADIGPPNAQIGISRRYPFSIKLEFLSNKLNILIIEHQNEGNEIELFTVNVGADISDNYIGFTAQSDRTVLRLDVKSIEFNRQTSTTRKSSLGFHQPQSHYSPDQQYLLRNPVFNATISEIIQRDQDQTLSHEGSSISSLFNVIDEINAASFEVAKFSELNDFVRNNILNYSQKWQRRTLKLIEVVKSARSTTESALNYSTSLMKAFNNTLSSTKIETIGSIQDLVKILIEDSDTGLADNHFVQAQLHHINRSPIIVGLYTVAIFEIIVFCGYLIYYYFSQ